MNLSEHISALIYLRNKVNKWKNIAIIFAIFSIFLIFKLFFDVDKKVMHSNYIGMIKVEDVIVEDDHRSKILNEILRDDSIRALIIRFNSPGGTIVGSEILFNELIAIKKVKPIVVLIDSIGASGAYMASLASDYIVVHNGTLTGSIGVIMESPNVADLADKVGVKFNSYKSSPLKGSPSMFEKASPVVDKVINESIQDSYNFFTDLVKLRRGDRIDPKFYNIVFDGRVFTGRQALKYGLVDEVGNIESAKKFLLNYGIDATKIPVQEIDITKKDHKLIDKFLNIIPFYHDLTGQNNFKNKIMAITN